MSPWRLAFLAGLLGTGALTGLLLPATFETLPATYTVGRAAVAGLLVGLGSSLGNGCTSGHGICGNARLSLRSFAFTLTMMVSGGIAALLSGAAAATGIATASAAPFALPSTPSLAPYASYLLLALLSFTALLQFVQNTPEREGKSTLSNAAEFLAGSVFAVGLALSGMTKPSKVAAFLSATLPSFDASLLFVMGGALLVATPAYYWLTRVARATAPVCEAKFDLPKATTKIDRDLLLGAVLFGAGWGIGGICPGPGLVNLVANAGPQVIAFNAAMIGGMVAHRLAQAAPALSPSNQSST